MENTVVSKSFETVGGVQVSVTIEGKNNNPNVGAILQDVQALEEKHSYEI